MRVEFPSVYRRFDDYYRYKVAYGGRAAARSWTIARKLLLRGVQKPLLILCTRELQRSIKDSVHRLLKAQIELMGLTAFYDITDTKITGLNGTEFIFLGTKHNSLEIKSMEGVDICWIEEAHGLTEDSWDVIDPTIRKEGSEIWISFNTRFKFDHIYKMFVVDKPPPSSLVIKTSFMDNPWLSNVLKIQLNTLKDKDYEKYLCVWEGELKQLADGAIFGKQIIESKKYGRFLPIPIQKNCEVFTFADLGKNDQSSFWFVQKVGMEYRFIDYFENRLQEVEYYTKFMKTVGYNYGTHYLPHDADHDRLGMVRNIKQQFEDGGMKPSFVIPRVKEKGTAIELARNVFNLCWFHKADDGEKPLEQCDGFMSKMPDGMETRAKRMEKGLDVLSNYRYRYLENDDTYHIKPHHDWASNGADAFQAFAAVAPTLGRSNNRPPPSDPEYSGDY